MMLRWQLWFGGHRTRFGLIFLLAALVGGALFVPHSEPLYQRYDRMSPGEVVRVGPTKTEVNGDRVMAVDAVYTDATGTRRTVRSYADAPPPTLGQTVAVLHDSGDVDDVKIAGLRTHPAPWWVAMLVMPFIAGGLWLAFGRLGHSRRAVQLLQRGRLTTATRIAQRASRWSRSDRQESIVTFEFTTADGHVQRCEAQAATLAQAVDGGAEPVLYDPGWPDHATALRHLPGAPALDGSGAVTCTIGPLAAAAAVLLPLACVAAAVALVVRTAISWS